MHSHVKICFLNDYLKIYIIKEIHTDNEGLSIVSCGTPKNSNVHKGVYKRNTLIK